MPSVAHDPRHSSLGTDYWLHRCEGFRVESPAWRIGTVKGVRFQSSMKPELLEVRAGLLNHRLFLIRVDDVLEILPRQRRIIVQARNQAEEGKQPALESSHDEGGNNGRTLERGRQADPVV